MDILIAILIIVVILICVIFVVYASSYNRFQDYIIRINEVEASIDTSLRSKYDFITRCVSIIKSKNDKEIVGLKEDNHYVPLTQQQMRDSFFSSFMKKQNSSTKK